ncbi:MAG: peptide ABC transporter permease [Bdellovibrio sp. CG10_big_fil_rev_8_21_14_0_10_47_8]|nr:MAG: peptide ABC transporter permease [Bdellovibrio sp. CG10_big_fil_rev_8_21_14_0_10_47_8]
MAFLRLALKSLRNRKFTTFLAVLSIALSTALLLSVERTRRATEEGFTQSISQTDLIVGARSGPINLILYTIFNMGSATNNISWESYQDWKKNSSVEWTIPYSLGDGHRGFRVVATDENFYEHYRFRGDQGVELAQGTSALGLWDVVLGSEVASQLHYQLGDRVTIAHGVTRGEGIQQHDDKPFVVSGIMKPTGTALDTSLYISLYGMEAIHMDWKDGAAPTRDKAIAASSIRLEDIKLGPITAFFLRTKSRIETLRLQRAINTYKEEPLLAIIPGATLSDLWRGLGYIEQALKMISWMVISVGLVAMLIAILTSLNERRREMSILRSIGAGPGEIAALLVFESALLAAVGVLIGLGLELSGFFLLKGWLESRFGLYLVGSPVTSMDLIYLLIIFGSGFFIGLIPAIKASRLALKDGLTAKV